MSFACHNGLVAIMLVALATSAANARELRVCADPNNLPFSNRAGAGFENHLATLIARETGQRVEYTWWAQRRGSGAYIRSAAASEGNRFGAGPQ